MDQLAKLPAAMDELLKGFSVQYIAGSSPFGLTQYIVWMLVGVILLIAFIMAAKKKQAESLAPKGLLVNGAESIVEFIRDDVCKGVLGKSWEKHFPFLATLFFFILFNNLTGLLPGGHPGTGTIGVTAALATCSFVYFIGVGVKRMGPAGYIKSLAPRGVPFPMNLFVWCIEIFSTTLRLITLAVRLFCNMFAGHVVMGAFSILTTLFVEPVLQNFTIANLAGATPSLAWITFLIIIYLVEMLVAVVQAYVFVLLSAVYIQLVEEEADEMDREKNER